MQCKINFLSLQAFKFPDSVNVHFQCVIQVCRFSCPEVNCDDGFDQQHSLAGLGQQQAVYAGQLGRRRRRRSAEAQIDSLPKNETLEVPATRIVQVMDPSEINGKKIKSDDFGFEIEEDTTLCITLPSYSGISVTVLLILLVSSVLHSVMTCSKLNQRKKK